MAQTNDHPAPAATTHPTQNEGRKSAHSAARIEVGSIVAEYLHLEIPKADEWINANQRLHWAVKSRRTKAWRQAAMIVARSAGLPKGLGRVHVTAQVWKSSKRRYDPHNLYPTAKAIIDGLVDYGLIVDDSAGYLDGPDMRHGGYGAERIVLVITPQPGRYE